MIFALYYAIALLLLIFEWRRPGAVARVPTPAYSLWVWTAVIVVTYVLELATEHHAAIHQLPLAAWQSHVPYLVVTRMTESPTLVFSTVLVLAAVQSYAVLGIMRAKQQMLPVAIGAALLVVLSLLAPVATNSDIYAYIGNALLGRQAYAPPPTPFPGEFSVINAIWHLPMTPTTYGPLWIVIVHLVTVAAPTLAAKAFALRLFNLGLYAALLLVLRAMRIPARLMAAVALNPAIFLQFIVNTHNDLLAIVIAVAAASIVTTFPLLATGCMVVAGLVKAPYVLLALPALARLRSVKTRFTLGAIGIAATAILSLASGGQAYLHALTLHVEGSLSLNVIHLVAALAAFAALVAVLVTGRRYRSGVWVMPALGAYIASWYVFWGFPYAIGRRRVFGSMLVMLPLIGATVDITLVRTWEIPLIAVALAAWKIAGLEYEKRCLT